MAITKKILKDKPFHNAGGQYNLDDTNTNLGLKKNVDSKFVDLDLYTLSKANNTNEEILKNNYIFQSPSYFKINILEIKNNGVGYDLIDNEVRIAVVSGNINNGSYSDLVEYVSDSSKRIYRKTWGVRDEGWSPGTIISSGEVVKEFGMAGLSPSYTFDDEGSNPSYDIESNFPAEFCEDSSSLNKINIIVWLKGNTRRGWGARWTDKRKRRIYHYEIDEGNFPECGLSGRTGQPESLAPEAKHVFTGDGGGGGAEAAAYAIKNFEIEMVAPKEEEDVGNVTAIEGAILPIKASPEELFRLQPTSIPNANWSDLINDLSTIRDFRPISIVTVGNSDFQSYYEYGQSVETSSPININLTFNMKNTKSLSIASGVEFDVEYVGLDGKFKFFVIDWNDKTNKIQDFEDIENWPSDINDLLLKQKRDDIYKYADCTNSSTCESLNHFYQTPGLKNIKAVVFLYTDASSGEIQAVRWKLVTIRINTGVDDVYVEDFGDLGGPDYTTIPWPHTSPVISGISTDSQYYASIERILNSGNFSETDLLDSMLLERAQENNELGDYIGRSDLAQSRYFNSGSFDMAYLLGISESITTDGTDFFPYDDNSYWSGNENNKFSDETSVGSIFIYENVDDDLRSKCIFELNMGDVDGQTIRDSSGNGLKGILIGDYRLNKPSKEIPTVRSAEMKLPLTDTKDKAF